MNISVIKSKKVCGNTPYLLGLEYGKTQVRIGLIWWHIVILLEQPK